MRGESFEEIASTPAPVQVPEKDLPTLRHCKEVLIDMLPAIEGQLRRSSPDAAVEQEFMGVMIELKSHKLRIENLKLEPAQKAIIDAYWKKIGN